MKILSDRFNVGSRTGTWELDVYGDTHLGTVCVDEKRQGS